MIRSGKQLPRAVLYLRSASARKADIDAAIPAKRHMCERRANELGARVISEYADIGDSGLTADRPQLQQMLRDLAELGDIAYVIAASHAAIATDMHAYSSIVWHVEQAGARLIIASTPLGDYDVHRSNPLGLMQAVAEWSKRAGGGNA